MPEDFQYKVYTEEEENIYNEAISKILNNLKNGLNFKEACSMVAVEDVELKGFIIDDALKVCMADMHFSKGMSLEQISNVLNIPVNILDIVKAQMFEDVGITASEIYKNSNTNSPRGNA